MNKLLQLNINGTTINFNSNSNINFLNNVIPEIIPTGKGYTVSNRVCTIILISNEDVKNIIYNLPMYAEVLFEISGIEWYGDISINKLSNNGNIYELECNGAFQLN